MKKIILDYLMKIIKNNKDYDDIKLEEIRYGLTSIYLLISKLLIIFPLGYLLGLFKEMIIFTLAYNIIRMPSFGLHATKSWICLLVSTITFIGIPYLCTILIIPLNFKIIIGIVVTFLFFKNAPADTHKKPIINKKRRLVYKYLSICVSIIFVILSLMSENFMSNIFLLSLVYQCFIISPTVYKIFNLPYDNYKTYIQINSVV